MTGPVNGRGEWESCQRPDGMVGRAMFSEDHTRRLVLTRRWVHSFAKGAEQVTWVMLNPSTAGAAEDDATIRKCVGYAKRWGFGAIRVLNLFDLIATDPRALAAHPDPSSRDNRDTWDWWLKPYGGGAWAEGMIPVIAAWGDGGSLHGQHLWAAGFFDAAGIRPRCLGVTRLGQPMHPGRTSYDLKPIPWEALS